MNTDLEQDILAGLDRGNDTQRVGSEPRSYRVTSDADTLKKIERALERIKSGDYGYCIGCGDPLPLGTLESDPTAESCLSCA